MKSKIVLLAGLPLLVLVVVGCLQLSPSRNGDQTTGFPELLADQSADPDGSHLAAKSAAQHSSREPSQAAERHTEAEEDVRPPGTTATGAATANDGLHVVSGPDGLSPPSSKPKPVSTFPVKPTAVAQASADAATVDDADVDPGPDTPPPKKTKTNAEQAPPATVSMDGPCTDNCALNGQCTEPSHKCVCAAGWAGPTCGSMRFKAIPAIETGYHPASADGFASWGGAPIKGPDGTYHLFATLFVNTTIRTWYRGSSIAHTTADNPMGPYTMKRIIHEPSGSEDEFDGTTAREPTIVHLPKSGIYLLYYVGHNCIRDEDECPTHASIGLMWAKKLDGRWHRHGEVVKPSGKGWDLHVAANPTAIVEEDESIWVYYRGDDTEMNGIGVLRAEHWKGPYVPQYGGYPIFGKRPKIKQSDMFAWRDSRGYHMLLCAQSIAKRNTGGLAYSADAVNWKLVTMRPAFGHELFYKDRGRLAYKQRARPQLLFEDGVPTHLFTAVEELKAHKTFTSVVPIDANGAG
mmetsp:Transcript_122643/g.212626  ORF Transcript_122643/g.212626 Transcript_122643/m.212626 type:complete len:519 (-) Transcript_122643:541-2097(-)